MRSPDLIWKAINVAAWLLAAVAWYFSDASMLRERIAIAETKIEQETIGYRLLQEEFGRRLERQEEKLDRLMEHFHLNPGERR